MIKFSHSIFALPFALSAVVLAWDTRSGSGWGQLGWIVVAMVAARSAAMGMNRIADRESDARNPRTEMRELPRGTISVRAATWFVIVSAAIFICAAGMLNRLCLMLSPIALTILLGYPYTKRWTWASHLALGIALGMAPPAAWIALTGTLDVRALLLTGVVMTWVAGFDILYSLLDVDFDRTTGLHSIPARFGVRPAFWIARVLHLATLLTLVALKFAFGLGSAYLLAVVVVAAALVYEHRLVGPDDFSRMDLAFFTMNGVVSVVFLVGVLADSLLGVGGMP